MNRRLVIAGFAVVGMIYVGVLFYLRPKSVVPPTLKTEEKKTGVFPSVEISSTSHYRNDVLGLEFDYPKEWGEPTTSPSTIITNLATVNKDYIDRTDHFDPRYMVTIFFKNKNEVSIKLINDMYPGKLYPNGGAYAYGPMDNFKEMAKKRNICDYKINFRGGIYYATELYPECKEGVKEVVVRSGQDGSKFENYELKRWSYKRLNNGYFDNLMVESQVAFAQSFNLNRQMTLAEIKAKEKIDESQDAVEKKKLIDMVASIKSFSPPKPTEVVFKDVVGEDANITTIRKYYYWLTTKNVARAWGMMVPTGVEWKKYQEWYSNVALAVPRDFKKLAENKYQLVVDYQDENTPPTRYLVVMEIIGGKIKTVSSEQLVGETAVFGNMSAVVRSRGKENYIILNKDGVETEIARGADSSEVDDLIKNLHFGELKFSNTGRYLTFYGVGWEWFDVYVFDTKTMKSVNLKLPSAKVTFNNLDTKVLACAQNEMTGDQEASIYEMTTAKKIKDFIKDSTLDFSRGGIDIDCSFDKGTQVATVKLIPWDKEQGGETLSWGME